MRGIYCDTSLAMESLYLHAPIKKKKDKSYFLLRPGGSWQWASFVDESERKQTRGADTMFG